ncbi:MAG: 16S rRNA (adenine(1518)-N(6)/adenine(1519)-N(6))-dimethyltransferase RsmA [Chloroflexi bacterium]|nr:16S rRNA (adenine(1518)-N(6)/adenine(1519)-N(6))-dimethyltransferase RsmA [Chloroflexota bacterium]
MLLPKPCSIIAIPHSCNAKNPFPLDGGRLGWGGIPIGALLISSQTHQSRPKKSLGQNFLVDRRVLGRIINAAEIMSEDVVVEIGPGRGILTRELAKTAAEVVAVELDDDLSEALAVEFAGQHHVKILHADAREVDIGSLARPGSAYKLVANLPYYAALPIVRRFLEAERKPSLMVFMVQREVARNMIAAPGDMSLLSVATQLYGNPRIMASVQPRAFRPAPKVTSAIVRIDVYEQPALALDSIEGFFTLVRAGFSAPRKQVHNCLQHGLDLSRPVAEQMLDKAGIDPKRRPQTLSLNDWGLLYDEYCQHLAASN